MVEIKHIIKSFEGRTVLNDVSALFEDGKTNLIIGRSGSGKTVLIKNIIGLMTPDSGEILYDGRDLTAMNKQELNLLRREMGMLFQGSALFDSMTVLENVMFPLDMFSNDTYRDRLKRAQFCLDRVNLSEAGHLYPSEISGGMMKRAAIARAIALNPKYLFCDEPNSGLDPETAIVIDKLISSITKEFGITTVMNTHDLNSILEIGDNIGYLYKGTILWEGDRHSIMNSGCEQLEEFLCSNMLARSIIQQNKKKVDI